MAKNISVDSIFNSNIMGNSDQTKSVEREGIVKSPLSSAVH